MEADLKTEKRGSLPIILIAAVLQGWSLYALHLSIANKAGPFMTPGVLLAFYAVAVLVPLTVQRLSSYMRERAAWIIIGTLTIAFAYFGWHHGAHMPPIAREDDFAEQWIPFGFVLGVLWLLIFPFIQTRLANGRWRADYADWFSTAWNNKLVLAEAALFTGVLWLLLLLMQELFFMLGIAFFRELFSKPLFIYPVTSLTFGVALHLIGSLERLTQLVLEQLLNVLKWLAILAGIILALFTLALAVKLPGLVATGERVIGAAWLLWLVAVLVLLINAAFRDGRTSQPYPRALSFALRCVVPLMVVIAMTALYAMYLRVSRYGFTVERVWACIVASAAMLYSIGYALAARDRDPWMGRIARVNVVVALFLIATLALALTPILSPYRIAAASQFAQVLEGWPPQDFDRGTANAMRYLRFSTGRYGLSRLESLGQIEGVPNAETIRVDARDMMELDRRWEVRRPPSLVDRSLSEMSVHPQGREVESELQELLTAHLRKPENAWLAQGDKPLQGLYVDMNADGTQEFVLFAGLTGELFERGDGGWRRAARLTASVASGENIKQALDAGNLEVVEPSWKELRVGRVRFRHLPNP